MACACQALTDFKVSGWPQRQLRLVSPLQRLLHRSGSLLKSRHSPVGSLEIQRSSMNFLPNSKLGRLRIWSRICRGVRLRICYEYLMRHAYEVRPRKDRRGVDLIGDALPFGRLWYGDPNAVENAIGYAQHYSRAHMQ